MPIIGECAAKVAILGDRNYPGSLSLFFRMPQEAQPLQGVFSEGMIPTQHAMWLILELEY